MLRSGFSEKPITPPNPVGHKLAGYIARSGVSQGVHDDIFARVIAIDADKPVVAVSLDLLGVDSQIYADIAKIANQVFGNSVLVASATHTHSAPATLFRSPLLTFCEDSFNQDYYSYFLDIVEKLLREATPSQPSSIHLCKSIVRGVATDRNNPTRYQALVAYSLVFTARDTSILLFNVGLHPTVLGPGNLLISSDLIGYSIERLKASRGLNGVLFFNGAAGNISTRFTRKSQTFDEARRLGYLLADQVETRVENCKPLPVREVEYKYEEVEVELESPQRKLEAFESAEWSGESGRVSESIREGLLMLRRFAECPGYPSSEVARLQILRLDDTVILTMPFEVHMNVYEELAKAAEEKKGIENLLLFSYSNGYLGYILNPEEKATYEKLAQLISEKSFEKLKHKLVSLLSLI